MIDHHLFAQLYIGGGGGGTNDETKPLEQHDIIRLSDDLSIESLFDYSCAAYRHCRMLNIV